MDRIIDTNNSVIFLPKHVLKHSRQGQKLDTSKSSTSSDLKLYILGYLKEHLRRRKERVSNAERKLFIRIKEPFHATSIGGLNRYS